jgi:hypothetical protein
MKKSLLASTVTAATLALSLASSHAAPIIVDGSFETPNLSGGYSVVHDGGTLSGNPAGPGEWVVSESNPGASAGISTFSGGDGLQVAYASNTAFANVGTLTQTTSTDFVVGSSYDLSVLAETYTGGGVSSDLGTFTLSLLDNGSVVASTTLPAVGNFTQMSLSYAGVDTGVIGVALSYASTSNGFQLGIFDNAVLTAATSNVPEPSSYAMMLAGFGVLALGLRFSRMRNSI